MKNKRMLAVDIGAGSGRIFCAEFNGEKLTMEESLRFSHRPATIRRVSTGTFWPSGMQFMRESAGQQIGKGI